MEISKEVQKAMYVVIILVVVILLLILVSYPKNCKNDTECFAKASLKCSSAKLSYYNEGNQFTYIIKGKRDDNCMAMIYFEKAKDELDPNLKKLLEGKGMFCEVPRSEITTTYYEVKSLNDYCTGPLKEAYMYITIEKLYGIVVKNVGQISTEMKKALEAKI